MNYGIILCYIDGCLVGKGVGDFIDCYVFFYGELLYLLLVVVWMSEVGLEVVDVESLCLYYVWILDFWSVNLEVRLKEVVCLVFEEILWIWWLYLVGCVYGFKCGWINLYQIFVICFYEDGFYELFWLWCDLYV